jgi:hypothetical protein
MEDEKKKRSIDFFDYLGNCGYYGFGKPNPAESAVTVMALSPKIDMSNISAEDRPYVHEVIQYLRQNSLTAELRGSATESNEYHDIDILAKGSLEDIANTVRGFMGIETHDPKIKPFYKTAADNKEYNVTNEGKEPNYMNTNIAQLFRIIVGNTKIHVGLKADPYEWYKYHSCAAA